MCGIAGWAGAFDLDGPAVLQAMMDAIAHRGPDGEGRFLSEEGGGGAVRIALGHRRLAIIDLATGHQPMSSRDGRTTLVFNGEIYNFRELRAELATLGGAFRSNSDTEVLLEAYRAWGIGCIPRLRGMFAFALWDARLARLVMARDPFGKKPLFLHNGPDTLIFASEIKALLAHPAVRKELDPESVAEYLLYRYVPGPHTFFAGIEKLPPGSYAVWSAGRLSVTRYFDPPDIAGFRGGVASYRAGTRASFEKAYLAALEESVRLRMVSDVPFGAFISGGVDSAAVVALMRRFASEPISTFSVGFVDDSGPGELPFARRVAHQLGTRHHEITVDAAGYAASLDPAIHASDAPVSEPASIPILLLSRAAAAQVKMVLTGEGADEFLGGYAKHSLERFARPYQALIPSAVRRVLQEATRVGPLSRVGRALQSLGLVDPGRRYPQWFAALPPSMLGEIYARVERRAHLKTHAKASALGQSALRRILLFDQMSWLPDNLLERGDRMTMAASLEARMPFMDQDLAAVTASLPDSCRIRGFTGKWLLRRAVRGLLPPEVANRRKLGFPVPLAPWFRGPLNELLYDHVLSPTASIVKDLIDPGELNRIVSAHMSSACDNARVLWLLLNLELFCRRYNLR